MWGFTENSITVYVIQFLSNQQTLYLDKYEEYIKRNLESLKAQCSHVTACIDKLLAEVSVTVLLKGDNISLNKTCG